MKKTKRVRKGIAIALLTVAVLVGGFFGIKAVRNARVTVDVVSVNMLNMGYFGGDMSMEGMVFDSDSQSVFPQGTQVVSEVYVTQGQEVKAGDRLMSYDMSGQQITLELDRLAVQQAQYDLDTALSDLGSLKSMKPIPERNETQEPEPASRPEPEYPAPETANPEQAAAGGAWNYLNKESIGQYLKNPDTDDQDGDGDTTEFTIEPQGTLADPFRYMVKNDGRVYGSFLNALKEQYKGSGAPVYVCIDVREGDVREGDIGASWLLRTDRIKDGIDDMASWTVTADDPVQKVAPEAEPEPEPEPLPQEGYTAAELARMIASREQDIRTLDLDLRRAQLTLKTVEGQMGDGIVYASKDGVVSVVHAPEDLPQDGSPFLKVSSGAGVMVQGSVSELQLDQLVPGQVITATSWETGKTYTGEIAAVNDYPVGEEGYYYYGGNPNSTMYGFTASLEDAEDLQSGTGLQLTVGTDQAMAENTNVIVLESAYIRSDARGSFVMKDDGGRLAKQYVSVGRRYYGQFAEIKDGISTEDHLAFPYGDGAREGLRTKVQD